MTNKIIITGIILLGTWLNVEGQTFTPHLYVIKADDKTLTADSNSISLKEDDANSDLVIYVNPNWIDVMEVVKGNDATEKYGLRAKNGVVVITLSKEGFSKMKSADKKKFEKNE